MRNPRLLDLFCGAGGCSVGYSRAGFDVLGVDNDPIPLLRYPFPSLQADAMGRLADTKFLDTFDVVHASPPCQPYSITRHSHKVEHPALLEETRAALKAWGGVYVIENVENAPMPESFTLCGSHLRAYDPLSGKTLRLRRHRKFESNVFLMVPPCSCDRTPVGGVYGGGSHTRDASLNVRHGGYTPPKSVRADLMGIDWMTQDQLSQAIPPAYTEWIGEALLEAIGRE